MPIACRSWAPRRISVRWCSRRRRLLSCRPRPITSRSTSTLPVHKYCRCTAIEPCSSCRSLLSTANSLRGDAAKVLAANPEAASVHPMHLDPLIIEHLIAIEKSLFPDPIHFRSHWLNIGSRLRASDRHRVAQSQLSMLSNSSGSTDGIRSDLLIAETKRFQFIREKKTLPKRGVPSDLAEGSDYFFSAIALC